MRLLGIVIMGALLTGACTNEPNDLTGPEGEDLDPSAGDGKFEAWNSANNPAYIDGTFLLYAHQLPLSGSGKDPIPSDYWAVARDNLNVKWDGPSSLSAAQKYGKAFGKSDTPKQVSLANGVLGHTERKTCTSDSQCSDLNDGSICAHPATGNASDDATARCIPTWWGICHGWAPYALSEPVAKDPVTKTAPDGSTVTFYPGDLEGLMSLMYTNVETKFLSQRCNKSMPTTDGNGRLVDGECRDMNPGSWHVLVTNLMGLRHQGFVLDQTYDDQVWNQPGWKYAITNGDAGQLHEITKAQAAQMLGLGMSLTSLLPTTTVAQGVDKTGSWTSTAAGDVTFHLTGTGDSDLYVKKGDAPTMSSYDCRPYTGTSVEDCVVTVAAGDTVYWMIDGYAATSSVQLGVATPNGMATYTYNTAAKKFYYVEMDFTFIVEAEPSRMSISDITPFAQTKHYSYVLEVDDFDKILGGEWVGDSRTDHPDFAWYPVATPTGSVAGISYSDIKALNDQSAGGATPPPSGAVTILDGYAFSSMTSKYVSLQVEPGVKKLVVTMTGTGDADLYVRKGQNPTLTTFGCRSATPGTASETCSVTVPASGGTYYVRAKPKADNTTVTITAEKQK